MGASKPSRSRRCIINSGAVSKTDSVFHPIGLNDDQVRKNYRSTEPGRSRKNRVAQTDRPPDGATKPCPPTDQKARTCDKARFRERLNGSTMPNRTGQPWPKVSSEPARPTRPGSFFARAQRPRSAARAEGARMNTANVHAGRLERRVRLVVIVTGPEFQSYYSLLFLNILPSSNVGM